MNLPFTALFERRESIENPSVPLAKALMGYETSTDAGVHVSDDKAASVPAVFASIQVLAQDLAKTPTKMRKRIDSNTFEDVQDHPLWELLHDLPNPETTAYEFKYRMMVRLLKHSCAYAEIQRNARGQVINLWVMEPTRMKVDRDGLNRKRYTYTLEDGAKKVWTFDASQPPILELSHESPIQRCRDLIGLAVAVELYSAKFFANGGRLSGLFSPEQPMSDLQAKNFLDSWNRLYAGAQNAFKFAFAPVGMKLAPFTAQNTDAQLNEIQKYIRTVIAGVFRVPPHKIGDLDRATFANIEHQAIEYVTGALDPFYVAWEQAIRRDLLTTRQYPNYDIVFDREAMIRADIQSRMTALATARQNGIYTTNDILKKLGENTKSAADGGDALLVNGNMLPIAVVLQPKAAEPEPTPEPEPEEEPDPEPTPEPQPDPMRDAFAGDGSQPQRDRDGIRVAGDWAR